MNSSSGFSPARFGDDPQRGYVVRLEQFSLDDTPRPLGSHGTGFLVVVGDVDGVNLDPTQSFDAQLPTSKVFLVSAWHVFRNCHVLVPLPEPLM